MSTQATQPSVRKAPRKPGMRFQIGLLVAMLVIPVPALLAAQAGQQLVAAIMVGFIALAMALAVRRL
jgi:hypothetical protein